MTAGTPQEDVRIVREQLSSPFRDGWREACDALDRLEQWLARLAELEKAIRVLQDRRGLYPEFDEIFAPEPMDWGDW